MTNKCGDALDSFAAPLVWCFRSSPHALSRLPHAVVVHWGYAFHGLGSCYQRMQLWMHDCIASVLHVCCFACNCRCGGLGAQDVPVCVHGASCFPLVVGHGEAETTLCIWTSCVSRVDFVLACRSSVVFLLVFLCVVVPQGLATVEQVDYMWDQEGGGGGGKMDTGLRPSWLLPVLVAIICISVGCLAYP